MEYYKNMKEKLSLMIIVNVPLLLLAISNVSAIQDNNTVNNNMIKYVNITSTKNTSIIYFPMDEIKTWYENRVNDNHNFVQDAYPIKDNGIRKTIDYNVYDSKNISLTNDFKRCNFLTKIFTAKHLSTDREHRVIGITDNDWYSQHGMASGTRGYTCFGNYQSALISVEEFRHHAAHEIGHTYWLCDEYNISGKTPWYDQDPQISGGCPNGDENPDDGQLDTNCLNGIQGCLTYTDRKLISYLSGEGMVELRNFMGPSTGNNNDRWISKESYKHLINKLSVKTNEVKIKKAVVVTGIIYKNDTVSINPIYWVENYTYINYSSQGNYSVIIKEGQNSYYSRNFTADYILYSIGGDSSILNNTGFAFVLPATESTTSFEIVKNGQTLEEINISPNTPQILVDSINESEPITKPFNLTWNATDVDNDALYYAILVSPDNGTNYTTLDIDYQNKYYEVDPNDFDYSEKYLFKIIVTDGTNTDYDYSNTVAMGVLPLTISSLQNLTINTTHMLFEFVINNTGSTTLNNINWTLNPGDGSSTIKSLETFSLASGSSAFVYIEYNYTTESMFIVNATANSGTLTASKNLSINLGNATPSNLDVYGFSMYNVSSTHKIFQFMIKNIATNQNLTGISWSLNTGLGTINSIYTYNLTPNNFSFVFVEYNYTQTGDFTPIASATSGTNQDSETLPTIDIPDIEASNLTLLYNNSLNRIFTFTISNMLSSSLNSVNWTFKPGDGNTLSANQLFSLNSSENAFVFIQYNYSSTGTYTANATAINGSLRDSTYYTFTIS